MARGISSGWHAFTYQTIQRKAAGTFSPTTPTTPATPKANMTMESARAPKAKAQTDATKHLADAGIPDSSLLDLELGLSLGRAEELEEWEILQHGQTIDSDGNSSSETGPFLPPASRSPSPKCAVTSRPPSEVRLRERVLERGCYELQPIGDTDTTRDDWDDLSATDSDCNSTGHYDAVIDYESRVHTVTQKHRESSKCSAVDYDIDILQVGMLTSVHPSIGKALIEKLYGRFPRMEAVPVVLVNENDKRRQFANDSDNIVNDWRNWDSKSLQASQEDLAPTTKGSSQWLDEWKKGKEEVQERLRVLYETGNRRTSYCTRI